MRGAFRSSFEVPKNQSCMSSARRHSRSPKERPSGRAHTNRRLETEIPKNDEGPEIDVPESRSRHLCRRFYQQLAPQPAIPGFCESWSSWPIKLYDRWQSLSSLGALFRATAWHSPQNYSRRVDRVHRFSFSKIQYPNYYYYY